MASSRKSIPRRSAVKHHKYLQDDKRQTQITLENFGLSQKSSRDMQNPLNHNFKSWVQMTNPKNFYKYKPYRSKRNRNFNIKDTINTKKILIKEDERAIVSNINNNTKAISNPCDQIIRRNGICIEKSLLETENSISYNPTSVATSSIKNNVQIQRSRDTSRIFQLIKKELIVDSRYNPDNEKHSEIKHKFPDNSNMFCSISKKEQFIDTSNEVRIDPEIIKIVPETLISSNTISNIREDLQIASEKDSDVGMKVGIAKKYHVAASKATSDVIIASSVHKFSKGEKGENKYDLSAQKSDSYIGKNIVKKLLTSNQMASDTPRSYLYNSRSSPDENTFHHLSAPKSSLYIGKQAVKHPINVNQNALGEVIIDDDNFHYVNCSQIQREKEVKFQLLRPEELGRKEFWHSYVNESRSPSFTLCKFQVKKKCSIYLILFRLLQLLML
jgi:hypothetical protein